MKTNDKPNPVVVGWIWQSGHGSQYKYEIIKNNSEEVELKSLLDGSVIKRYTGQIRDYGITYKP